MKTIFIGILKKILSRYAYHWIRDRFLSVLYFVPRRKVLTRKITFFDGNQPCLSYALMVPKNGQFVHGGRVKLSYLNKIFPEQTNKFNILYLASSILPRYLSEWIKVCKKVGVKIVLNQNGVYYYAWYGKGWQEGNRLLKIALESADYIIYQSEFAKIGADTFLGVPKAPSDIIFNAVDVSLFTPQETHQDDNQLTILMAGTCNDFYRLRAAVLTIKILKTKISKVKLLIAGRLSWLANKRQVYKEMSILLKDANVEDNVVLLPTYSQREAPDIFRRADIFLHPQYNDVCPTVVVEAMACGLPVVFLMNGGTPELVGTDAGIGVHSKQSWDRIDYPIPALLAEAVLKVNSKRKVFSAAARERAVRFFDINIWNNKHRDIFEELLRKKNEYIESKS